MQNWPKGSGKWSPIKTLVVSSDRDRTYDAGTLVVSTPLDMISYLEDTRVPIATVILAGSYARDREMAKSLRELYPSVQIAFSMVGG